MIIEKISPNKEPVPVPVSQGSSLAQNKWFPTQLKDAKGARVVADKNTVPSQKEYDKALAEWNTKHITAAGQKMYVKFSPNAEYQERIFSRILSREESHIQKYNTGDEVQMIEAWMPKSDYFTRVCPALCSNLNKGK